MIIARAAGLVVFSEAAFPQVWLFVFLVIIRLLPSHHFPPRYLPKHGICVSCSNPRLGACESRNQALWLVLPLDRPLQSVSRLLESSMRTRSKCWHRGVRSRFASRHIDRGIADNFCVEDLFAGSGPLHMGTKGGISSSTKELG